MTETKVLGLLENIYLPVTVISSFPYCSMQVQQSDEQAIGHWLLWLASRFPGRVVALSWSQSQSQSQRRNVQPTYCREGDRLRAGKPSQHITSHPGQLSLAILRGWTQRVGPCTSEDCSDALVPNPWTRSISWCLGLRAMETEISVELEVGLCDSGRTAFLIYVG